MSSSENEKSKQSLDQKRAAFALNQILRVEGEQHKEKRGNYRAYVRSLPMLIVTNSLGQALAFEISATSKGGKVAAGHELLLEHICEWLVGNNGWDTSPYSEKVTWNNNTNPIDVLKAVVEGSEADMRRTQMELMAYLKWLKKFAEASLPKSDEE